jgi:hypothetical protein
LGLCDFRVAPLMAASMITGSLIAPFYIPGARWGAGSLGRSPHEPTGAAA